ncbi:Zn2/Cys6 DNA-binding protein [Sarocladium implicatum]|nr:Zn2/Cys6 DNA-binding protein [Sarocladium implicatum]
MEHTITFKRGKQPTSKVKTGCKTLKCDESKPACQKCASTGRKCDGYDSMFRPWQQTSNSSFRVSDARQLSPSHRFISPLSITQQDVDLLQRCLCTKTLLDVDLDCDGEAREILEASLTDPAIQHAVSSLKSIRQDLEHTSNPQQSPSKDSQELVPRDGIEQYCAALGSLASQLSSSVTPDHRVLRSAILCCQIFMSIEQTRGNFTVMMKHMLQGLNIMQEHRARPRLVASELLPAKYDDLPLLDVYLIKLFAAPCKFTDRRPAADTSRAGTLGHSCPIEGQLAGSNGSQLIAPDVRTVLTKIAASTLQYLDGVSRCASTAQAQELLEEKGRLLRSLELWRHDLSNVEEEEKLPAPELLSVSFMCLFHQIMRLILMGSLDATATFYMDAHTAAEELKMIAEHVTVKVGLDRLERQAERELHQSPEGMW